MNKKEQQKIIINKITEQSSISLDCLFNEIHQDMEICHREINTSERKFKLLNDNLDASVRLAITAADNGHIN